MSHRDNEWGGRGRREILSAERTVRTTGVEGRAKGGSSGGGGDGGNTSWVNTLEGRIWVNDNAPQPLCVCCYCLRQRRRARWPPGFLQRPSERHRFSVADRNITASRARASRRFGRAHVPLIEGAAAAAAAVTTVHRVITRDGASSCSSVISSTTCSPSRTHRARGQPGRPSHTHPFASHPPLFPRR